MHPDRNDRKRRGVTNRIRIKGDKSKCVLNDLFLCDFERVREANIIIRIVDIQLIMNGKIK